MRTVAVAGFLIASALAAMPTLAQPGEPPMLMPPAAPGEGVQVGVVSLVNPDATLDRSAASREPMIGDDVLLADRLATDAAGQVHLMLLDKSAFTIGPNSDVTIDRFVYDPETRAGEMAISAVRGVMRFVGGDLSKDQPVEIRTGTGTLGIRGGILLIDIQDDGGITAIFGYGVELTVQTALDGGAFESINRAGYMIQIAPDGTIADPVPAPAAIVQDVLRSLEGPTPPAPGTGTPPAGGQPPEGPAASNQGTPSTPTAEPTAGTGTAGPTGTGTGTGEGGQVASPPTPPTIGAGGFPLPPIRVQVAQALTQPTTGFVLQGRPVTIDSLVESDSGLLASVEGNLVAVNDILSDTIDQAIAEATQSGGDVEEAVAATVPALLAQFRFLVFDRSGQPADQIWLKVTDGITEVVLNSGSSFKPASSPEIGVTNEYFELDNTFREGGVNFNFFMDDCAGTSCSNSNAYVGIEMVGAPNSDTVISSITDNSTQVPNTLGDLTGTNQDQIDTDGVAECANLSGCAAFGTITVNASNP